LATFAKGLGTPEAREALSAHVRGCATCQASLVPLALKESAQVQTHFDSPNARGRRTSRDAPKVDPLDVTDPGPGGGDDEDTIGLEDTHHSGESAAARGETTASGVRKGEALDRYVILDRLGAGAMGEVFTAWDPVLDRKVAIKVLKADFEGSELGEELKQRLLREAQALARLSHPNVVTVHDVGLAGDRVFLAMEFAEGQTLKKWLEGTPRTWRQVIEIFLAAGEGLAAAHGQGLTHRDFKPENVMVGRDRRVRVMDFGLAHGQASKKESIGGSVRRTITAPGAMLGTPAYMSPEALHGQATDARSDEFSFCVSLYEALYGVRPFEGATPGALANEIGANRVRPPPRGTQVPRRIHQLIVKGLRADPAERFQTMRALLVQLGRRKTAKEQQLTIAAVALVAALAVGLSAFVAWRDRTRCADVATRLDAAWNAEVREKAHAAFSATGKPWAETAWTDVERRLDAWALEWRTLRKATCEARATGDDEGVAQEMLCLGRRLTELEATTQLFAAADADVVERAVVTASALPSAASCRAAAKTAQPARAGDESLRPALAAVRVRLDTGKYAEASTLASDLATKADAVQDREIFAEARLLAAVARVRQGDPKQADALVEESILSAASTGDDEVVARGWVERVGFAALLGPSPEAERWVRFARAAVARAGNPPELEASFANNLGVLAHFRGQFEAAVQAHQRAITLRRQLFGDQHPLVARSHTNLGTAFKGLGKLEDARAQYALALSIEEQALGPTHPAVADTLNNLGNVLQAQGDLKGARTALERSLRIKEGAHGPDTLPVAVTLTNLGALLLELRELGEAAALLERALAIKEQRAGPDTLTVAITLTNLAQAHRQSGRWAQAIALDERALGLRKARQGERHVDLAYNLTGLGQARWMTKDAPRARAELEAALTLRTERGPERAETAYWLALALEGTKDPRVKTLVSEAQQDLPPGNPLQGALTALAARVAKRR
jgi:tetratricopeptide (TPR) repeat protein/tRNA A-37 threonylcarbamoyl transferase component Bud32